MTLKRERGSNKSTGLCKLAIEQDMTIYTIQALKEGFSAEIESYERFELNLAAVEEVDSAGIQLLLALQKELKRNKKELKLTAASTPVTKLIDDFGLTENFSFEGAQ